MTRVTKLLAALVAATALWAGFALVPGGTDPAAAASRADCPNLTKVQRGSTGVCVKTVQEALNGYYEFHPARKDAPLLVVDSVFGPLTEARVKEYQAIVGLTADGIVGPLTWASLAWMHDAKNWWWTPGRGIRSDGWRAMGDWKLHMQLDGNLVLYKQGQPVWATHTAGNPGAYMAMEADGRLSVFAKDSTTNRLWSSPTEGRTDGVFVFPPNGDVGIYGRDGKPIWVRPTMDLSTKV